MSEVIVLFSILFIIFVGYLFNQGFGLLKGRDIGWLMSCSYGLGVGVIATQMFLYSRLSIPWERETLLLPWVFVGIVLYVKKKIFLFSLPKSIKLYGIDYVFLICILLAMGYVFFEALLRPVSVWDGWAIWLLKSKVFFIDGYISPDALRYVGPEYPITISLLGTFIYTMLGYVDDRTILLTSFAFYFFLVLGFFSALKNKFGTTYALFFTFLFVTIQNFIRHGGRLEAGQADLPLGFFMFISTLLTFEYYKTTNVKTLVLLALFLGIIALTKLEGLPFIMVIVTVLLYIIHKKKCYAHFWTFLLYLIPIMDWMFFKSSNNLGSTYIGSRTIEFVIPQIQNAFYGTFKELINIKTWSFLWIAYFYLFMIKSKKNIEINFLHVVILSQLILYLLIYSFVPEYTPDSSIERLLVHIAPLALYEIAIKINDLYGNKFFLIFKLKKIFNIAFM